MPNVAEYQVGRGPRERVIILRREESWNRDLMWPHIMSVLGISLHVCVELFTTFNPFSTPNQEEVDGLRTEAGRIRVYHKEMDGGLPIVWDIFSYFLCLEMLLPKLHRTKTKQYLTRVLMLNILDLMYICFWILTIALKNRWLVSSCIEFIFEKWIF